MLVVALRIPYTDGLEPNGKIKAGYKVLRVLKVKQVLRVLKVLKAHKENHEASPFN